MGMFSEKTVSLQPAEKILVEVGLVLLIALEEIILEGFSDRLIIALA